MNPFLEKTIRFLGKSQNPSANDILTVLLGNPDISVRSLAFDSLYLKKTPEILISLFERFAGDEEAWLPVKSFSMERLFRLAEAAYRSDNASLRNKAGNHPQVQAVRSLSGDPGQSGKLERNALRPGECHRVATG